MTDAQAAILEEITSLLAEPEHGTRRPSLARLEDTLTSGYARALELEAEQLRLERRIGEMTSRLAEGNGAEADELSSLAERASRADGDLRRLRRLLESLRTRASAQRASGASVVL
jgi:GAF domain-containing protein